MIPSGAQSFTRLINHPLKSRWFLFSRLPSAFFSGVRIAHADESSCRVSVPYTWFSKNPFRSTYFACLSMAAEMSAGVLALMHTYQRSPSVSTLVVKMESEYFKKATDKTYFTCENGAEIRSAIDTAIASGTPQNVITRSIGVNAKGDKIASFSITWSFKARKL
jgi:hypothetical protein